MAATNGAFWTQQFLKSSGLPYAGVRVFHYVAGATTTNLDVYQNGNLTAPHNNPVVGDASGRVAFYGNGTYRLQVRSSTADGNLLLYDWDPVELMHHTATVRAEDKAVSLPAADSAGRGRIFGVTDGGGDLTSLWLQRTASTWQQILTLPTLAQMIEFAKGSTIASSTNVNVPADGNFFDVTGTNSIETLSGFSGYPIIYTRTLSALTFVHSANLVLQGAQNRTTLANQVTAWLHLGAGQWMELFYTNPLLGDSNFVDGAVLVGNGQNAITDLALPTVSRVLGHSGTAGQDPSWLTGLAYHGPTAVASGSTRTHEGNVTISGNQNLSGIHFYTNFTLNAGVTVTLPAGSKRLVIVASDSITINGAIAANGAGGAGGTAGAGGGTGNGGSGGLGTDQPGGTTTGGGSHGYIVVNGCVLSGGASQLTGSDSAILPHPLGAMGGGGGAGASGDGGGTPGGAGGAGGASIVLVAPSVIMGSAAVLNTSGAAGGNGTAGFTNGGGGGGGGNIYILTRSYTDNGATFTMTGGAGGTGNASGSAGQTGVKQVNIYG